MRFVTVFGPRFMIFGFNCYEPREVKITEEMSWNGGACDVGEFGVDSLPLTSQPLRALGADGWHARGLVFEPVGSLSDAKSASEQDFTARVEDQANLDRVAQVFIRKVRQRMGLVYYPLWVIRYRYRGRAFQVVLDGYSGKILDGKAPGSTLYRAAVLVGGMAAGAFLSVDASALALWLGSQGDGNGVTHLQNRSSGGILSSLKNLLLTLFAAGKRDAVRPITLDESGLRITVMQGESILAEYDLLTKRWITGDHRHSNKSWQSTLALFRQHTGFERTDPRSPHPDDIFLIADLHLGHANIIRYCSRPFLVSDVREMDHVLIKN